MQGQRARVQGPQLRDPAPAQVAIGTRPAPAPLRPTTHLNAKQSASAALITAAVGEFRYPAIQFSQGLPLASLSHNPLIVRAKSNCALSKTADLSSLKLEYSQECA